MPRGTQEATDQCLVSHCLCPPPETYCLHFFFQIFISITLFPGVLWTIGGSVTGCRVCLLQRLCVITTRFSSTSRSLTPTLNAGTSWHTSAFCSRWLAVLWLASLDTARLQDIHRVRYCYRVSLMAVSSSTCFVIMWPKFIQQQNNVFKEFTWNLKHQTIWE